MGSPGVWKALNFLFNSSGFRVSIPLLMGYLDGSLGPVHPCKIKGTRNKHETTLKADWVGQLRVAVSSYLDLACFDAITRWLFLFVGYLSDSDFFLGFGRNIC